MRQQLEDLRQENLRLSTKLRSTDKEREELENDLDITRSLLNEKESDYADILEQLSNQDQTSSKANGVLIFDKITEKIADKLAKPNINWERLQQNPSNINTKSIACADVVLLATGAEEIVGGASAFQIFQELNRIISELSRSTLVYCISLPPAKINGVQLDLFNHKLLNFECSNQNVKILKVKVPGSKSLLVEPDGITPSDKCVAYYVETATEITPPSTLKTFASPSNPSIRDLTVIFPIKSEQIGKIIGRGGNVIRKLTEMCDVKMSFGKWHEKNEDAPAAQQCVMIKGSIANIDLAKSKIDEILKDN